MIIRPTQGTNVSSHYSPHKAGKGKCPEVLLLQRLVWVRYKELYWWPALLSESHTAELQYPAAARLKKSTPTTMPMHSLQEGGKILMARLLGMSATEIVEVTSKSYHEFYSMLPQILPIATDMSLYGKDMGRFLDLHRALDQVEAIMSEISNEPFPILPEMGFLKWEQRARAQLSSKDYVGCRQEEASGGKMMSNIIANEPSMNVSTPTHDQNIEFFVLSNNTRMNAVDQEDERRRHHRNGARNKSFVHHKETEITSNDDEDGQSVSMNSVFSTIVLPPERTATGKAVRGAAVKGKCSNTGMHNSSSTRMTYNNRKSQPRNQPSPRFPSSHIMRMECRDDADIVARDHRPSFSGKRSPSNTPHDHHHVQKNNASLYERFLEDLKTQHNDKLRRGSDTHRRQKYLRPPSCRNLPSPPPPPRSNRPPSCRNLPPPPPPRSTMMLTTTDSRSCNRMSSCSDESSFSPRNAETGPRKIGDVEQPLLPPVHETEAVAVRRPPMTNHRAQAEPRRKVVRVHSSVGAVEAPPIVEGAAEDVVLVVGGRDEAHVKARNHDASMTSRKFNEYLKKTEKVLEELIEKEKEILKEKKRGTYRTSKDRYRDVERNRLELRRNLDRAFSEKPELGTKMRLGPTNGGKMSRESRQRQKEMGFLDVFEACFVADDDHHQYAPSGTSNCKKQDLRQREQSIDGDLIEILPGLEGDDVSPGLSDKIRRLIAKEGFFSQQEVLELLGELDQEKSSGHFFDQSPLY